MNMTRTAQRGWLASLLLCCICIVGCKQETAPGAGDGPANVEAKGTIGYSALTFTNPFFNTIRESMEAEATKHGYKLVSASGERDVKKQADQIDDFIVKEVVAIVLNPCDKSSIGPAIRKANEAGIPVFTNDLAYVGDDAEVVCHVATDNLQGGHLAGRAMVKLLGESGGKVAVIDFPQAESCKLRVDGFLAELEQHNTQPGAAQIELVYRADGGGVRDEGFNAAKDALQAHPDLAAIFAINDPSALGAYSAVEGAGKTDQVKIIGFDGEKAGKQAIRDGKIVCDPVQYPDQIGAKTIEMIVKYFAGDDVAKETNENGHILIPSKLYYQSDALADPALQE